MKHLILDIGGVFYRGWPDETFLARWTARTGLTREVIVDLLSSSPEHRAAQVGKMTADEAFAAAGRRLGLEGALVRALAEEAYLSDFNERMAEAMRALRAEGVPVSALTNTLSTEAELQARPEFAGLFEMVISSHDVGLAKPDPAIFHAAIDRLGVAAADAVFVDDLIGHVEAARALGFTGVHFQTTEQALGELATLFPGALNPDWRDQRIAAGMAAARDGRVVPAEKVYSDIAAKHGVDRKT
jgi:putative hydrolase of the HAD superfamily